MMMTKIDQYLMLSLEQSCSSTTTTYNPSILTLTEWAETRDSGITDLALLAEQCISDPHPPLSSKYNIDIPNSLW